MSAFPKFRLFDILGTTLVRELEYVTNINDYQDPGDFVEISTTRGTGAVIIPGGDLSWNLTISFYLMGNDYEDLTAQIQSLQSDIPKYTGFILRVDDTITTTTDYKVMRVQSIQFPVNATSKKRVTLQRVILTFRVNTC